MSVKVIKDDNRVPELLEIIEDMRKMYVEVGIMADSGSYSTKNGESVPIVVIAEVHEFGKTMTHSQGGTVTVPERSYLRATVDEKANDISREGAKLFDQVMHFELSPYTAYDTLGQYCVGLVQEHLTSITNPPLSPVTIALRENGGSSPLMDTGKLRESITHRVVTS